LQYSLLPFFIKYIKEYVDYKNGRVPKNPEKLRSLMREVMVRNTRALVDVKLPKRFATTITVTPSAGEEKLYQDLSEYLRSSEDKLDRLSRTNLLMRAGSSPGALADSLKQLTKRLPDEELKSLARRASQVKQVEKAKALVEMLSKSRQKTLVFTTHKATSNYLAKTLQAANIPFAEFLGGMSLKQKDEAIAAFRDNVSVLLASETGGEGRNIQFANAIVNYDLPWNPMKIEQRIGRIHRIGQTQDVFIFNFCLKGSIEEYILRILHDKINMFELVVGEIETILGNVVTIIFGLSRWFWLSLLMLVLSGALDTISVVIRHTLVQIRTPDNLRGRVAAINSVFISASNELGGFESGLTAALFGPVVSVVGGGIDTIAVVIAVAAICPGITKLGALQEYEGK
jgi:SNF2 family DNA or RNA helicase